MTESVIMDYLYPLCIIGIGLVMLIIIGYIVMKL